MRKPIVGISMKTYQNNFEKAMKYTEELMTLLEGQDEIDLFYCPSIGLLHTLGREFGLRNVKFGAQNIGSMLNGPQTGEFSIEILKEIKGEYVELGHAERKYQMNETFEMIAKKVDLTLQEGLSPVLCIGDREKVNSDAAFKDLIKKELKSSTQYSHDKDMSSLVIAYEPVWAIGAEESADAAYVWNAHHLIRQVLSELYGEKTAQNIRIIYGGSVSKENTRSLVEHADVDGVFVGRFGHDPNNFKEIVEIVKDVKGI